MKNDSQRLVHRQAQNSLKLLGVTLDCKLKFHEHAKNVTFKVKRVMGIIGKLGRIYKGIVGNVPVSPHPIKGVPEQIYTYLLSF